MEQIKTVAEVEKEHILETVNKLKETLDLQRIAAKLGIGKTTLYRKLREWKYWNNHSEAK